MTSGRCVLLAEDDTNDVLLLRHAFTQADVQNPLYSVADGQEAIDYLSGTGEFADRMRFPFPALAILDVKMPRKTGLEVLHWLQEDEKRRCLPTIMLSSSAHPDDVDQSYRLGANAFIVKPSGTAARVELARMIKGFWLNLNELPSACR